MILPDGRIFFYAKKEENMAEEVLLIDGQAVSRTIRRLSHEISEKNGDLSSVVLVGILRRGATMAKMLSEEIEKIEGVKVPVEFLDITFYRDDLKKKSDVPQVEKRPFENDINGKCVIITDDVIFTGRTVRAAIDAVMNIGRPSRIQLAVLVDRGHRELPIRPDYVGKNVPTSLEEKITVCFEEYDGEQKVVLSKR